MKKLILLALFSGLFTGCSSDDAAPDSDSSNIYMPLETGNYWTYDVTSSAAPALRDSLYVAGDTTVAGNSYKKMKARAVATGFFTTSLNQNAVRKVGSSVVVHGTSALNLGGALPLDIPLADFVIFRENAEQGALLSSVANEITQEFEGFPLTLEYEMRSTAGETLSTYTSNGVTYNDVKSVRVVLNMQINSTVNVGGFNVDVPIMGAQDVVVSDLFFAKNIGMVKANTVISYNLEDLSGFGISLPIPESSSVSQSEVISDYNVEAD